MDYEPKRLKLWTMPRDYAGEMWPAYYSAGVGQSRDSSDLEASNFATMLALLGGESETVLVVHEGHWAVGWVEWIAVHQDDGAALKIADEACQRLDDYPVLDEDDWSRREMESAERTWRECYSLKERVELCRKGHISIFAARRDYPPSGDNGYIYERLLGQ